MGRHSLKFFRLSEHAEAPVKGEANETERDRKRRIFFPLQDRTAPPVSTSAAPTTP